MISKELIFNFSSKNFILTGAGKGIGFAILKKLYEANANVAVITRSKSDIEKIRNVDKFTNNKLKSVTLRICYNKKENIFHSKKF